MIKAKTIFASKKPLLWFVRSLSEVAVNNPGVVEFDILPNEEVSTSSKMDGYKLEVMVCSPADLEVAANEMAMLLGMDGFVWMEAIVLKDNERLKQVPEM